MNKKSPAVDSATTELVHDAAPFSRLVGFEVIDLGREELHARVAWRAELTTTGAGLHGGALMTLADICGGMLAFTNLPTGATGTSTVESKTNFFRPLREGDARARAKILHRGRRSIVVETEVFDDSDRLVSKTTQTEAVLDS